MCCRRGYASAGQRDRRCRTSNRHAVAQTVGAGCAGCTVGQAESRAVHHRLLVGAVHQAVDREGQSLDRLASFNGADAGTGEGGNGRGLGTARRFCESRVGCCRRKRRRIIGAIDGDGDGLGGRGVLVVSDGDNEGLGQMVIGREVLVGGIVEGIEPGAGCGIDCKAAIGAGGRARIGRCCVMVEIGGRDLA